MLKDLVAVNTEAFEGRLQAERAIARAGAAPQDKETERIVEPDTVNAPIIKDSSPGMDRHSLEFQSILDCPA